MTATALLTRRYLSEYARRPINLALLVIVPVIFVILAAGALADFVEIIGEVADAGQLAAPTAGWAAAFLAGVAGFFHVLGSCDADRRLADAGLGAGPVVSARLLSGLVLALVAAATAVVALAVRTGIADPSLALAGTFLFAVIYLAIGAAVGAVAKTEINGSLVVIFIWMFDVFLGPGMAATDIWITRLFPSHFVTLVMMDVGSGHTGPISDLGWAIAWAVGALVLATAVFYTATTHPGPTRTLSVPSSGWARVGAGLRFGFRDYRRNIVMWVLLILLPVLFISLSFYITPDDSAPVELTENGTAAIQVMSMIDVHGAIMVPITIGFLAGLVGLFVVQGSLDADARLAIAGFRAREILASRLGIIGFAGLLTTAVSLVVTAFDFSPESWGWFTVGGVLVVAIYGMVGVVVGAVFGRLGGLYVMFLLPFIDVGIAQNVMFSAAPPDWGILLPARGAVQVLVDAAFTPTFDQTAGFWLAMAWLVALAAATGVVFRWIAAPTKA